MHFSWLDNSGLKTLLYNKSFYFSSILFCFASFHKHLVFLGLLHQKVLSEYSVQVFSIYWFIEICEVPHKVTCSEESRKNSKTLFIFHTIFHRIPKSANEFDFSCCFQDYSGLLIILELLKWLNISHRQAPWKKAACGIN